MSTFETTPRLFISYKTEIESFVAKVCHCLKRQARIETFFAKEEMKFGRFPEQIKKAIENSDYFVLFLTKETSGSKWQIKEINYWLRRNRITKELGIVNLSNEDLGLPPTNKKISEFQRTNITDYQNESDAVYCADEILRLFQIPKVRFDDLPIGYPFDYEKKIIEEYSKKELPGKYIALGCPKEWPTVEKKKGQIVNKILASEIGLFADWVYKDGKEYKPKEKDPQVLVAALTDLHPDDLIRKEMTFPEARPRKLLYYPKNVNKRLTVGVMVSGGIAPGINAVIAGIVERHFLYAERGGYGTVLRVNGYYNGLKALLRVGSRPAPLNPDSLIKDANLGGSILGTSRAKEFMNEDSEEKVKDALEKAVNRLSSDGTEILYIIGGDGSMRAAHALQYTAQVMKRNISIIGIPKTMDNDILWVWQSFGFLSAVQWSKEAIEQLHTEAKSNPRLCVIQLFGSDSGFVVTHAVTASGVCDLFLIPEVPFTMEDISKYIKRKLVNRYNSSGEQENTYGVVVMAETAIPTDAEKYMNDTDIDLTDKEKKEIGLFLGNNNRRVFGQTPDDLRTGGLKLVSRVLQRNIRGIPGEYWEDFRVFTNEPRHLIRSIPPSSSDIIFGHRIGSLAVDCAMAGYTDFMISQWLTEFVMVPLKLVTLGRKRIPKDGIFYKSAKASTEQPASLIDAESFNDQL